MFPVLRMYDPPGTLISITNLEAHQSFRYTEFLLEFHDIGLID